MASRYPLRSKQRTVPRKLPYMSERQMEAYFAARETLRRIERSAALAFLTSDAVKIHWTALGSIGSGSFEGARTQRKMHRRAT